MGRGNKIPLFAQLKTIRKNQERSFEAADALFHYRFNDISR